MTILDFVYWVFTSLAVVVTGSVIIYLFFRLASSAIYRSKIEFIRRFGHGKDERKK